MYRIRFHGRGGQGMKTASRILGRAFFLEGFEVQDAPRYGAERRGAPIFAYVRSSRKPINERGVISRPDLIIVADDSLVTVPAAGILAGCQQKTSLLLHSDKEPSVWQDRLHITNPIVTLPFSSEEQRSLLGTACAGGAARLVGVIQLTTLEKSVRQEIGHLGDKAVAVNLAVVRQAFEALSDHAGSVQEGQDFTASDYTPPAWIDLPFDRASISSPTIHGAATSEALQTGLWRTVCPVIDKKRCKGCWWICSTFCPEGAIQVDEERRPQIDYDHCKGCLVCLAQCPAHAIEARPEKYEDSLGEKK